MSFCRVLWLAAAWVRALSCAEIVQEIEPTALEAVPLGGRTIGQGDRVFALLNMAMHDAAVACWDKRPACAVIKHTTPCGIAVAGSAAKAWARSS